MSDLQLLVLILIAIALGAMVGYAYGWQAGQRATMASFRGTLGRWTFWGRRGPSVDISVRKEG